MTKNEADKLYREAQELQNTAIDLIEHAALLIMKAGELQKQIEKANR